MQTPGRGPGGRALRRLRILGRPCWTLAVRCYPSIRRLRSQISSVSAAAQIGCPGPLTYDELKMLGFASSAQDAGVLMIYLAASAQHGGPGTVLIWLLVVAVLIAVAAMMRRDRSAQHVRKHSDQFVEPCDLDASCSNLLFRTQRAIGTVLRSGVYADDLLDHAVEERVLKWHEHEIADALRAITRLRAEHASSAAAAPGPMTAAVLDSHKRALMLALDATTSRISTLECYAAQLEAADAAKRDWQRAIEVYNLNDQYRDLVARTAADEHAIAEITSSTKQAATAAQLFRDSLHQANVTAEVLALPAAQNG
jgi:hypothetical protein